MRRLPCAYGWPTLFWKCRSPVVSVIVYLLLMTGWVTVLFNVLLMCMAGFLMLTVYCKCQSPLPVCDLLGSGIRKSEEKLEQVNKWRFKSCLFTVCLFPVSSK